MELLNSIPLSIANITFIILFFGSLGVLGYGLFNIPDHSTDVKLPKKYWVCLFSGLFIFLLNFNCMSLYDRTTYNAYTQKAIITEYQTKETLVDGQTDTTIVTSFSVINSKKNARNTYTIEGKYGELNKTYIIEISNMETHDCNDDEIISVWEEIQPVMEVN